MHVKHFCKLAPAGQMHAGSHSVPDEGRVAERGGGQGGAGARAPAGLAERGLLRRAANVRSTPAVSAVSSPRLILLHAGEHATGSSVCIEHHSAGQADSGR